MRGCQLETATVHPRESKRRLAPRAQIPERDSLVPQRQPISLSPPTTSLSPLWTNYWDGLQQAYSVSMSMSMSRPYETRLASNQLFAPISPPRPIETRLLKPMARHSIDLPNLISSSSQLNPELACYVPVRNAGLSRIR